MYYGPIWRLSDSVFNLQWFSLHLKLDKGKVSTTSSLISPKTDTVTNNKQNRMKDGNEKQTNKQTKLTFKVNMGFIAKALMSLLLISVTGNRWHLQMFVINKRVDSRPVGPVLNNWLSHVVTQDPGGCEAEPGFLLREKEH